MSSPSRRAAPDPAVVVRALCRLDRVREIDRLSCKRRLGLIGP